LRTEKTKFTTPPNICGDRIRAARAMRNLSQEDLAYKCQFAGVQLTKIMISRIECKQRHVVDGELITLSNVLDVNVPWLLELTNDHTKIYNK
jgi:transcriptional regulator with XRE-family HTH domain